MQLRACLLSASPRACTRAVLPHDDDDDGNSKKCKTVLRKLGKWQYNCYIVFKVWNICHSSSSCDWWPLICRVGS